MPVVQCPNPINCEGTDSPLANLSAEGPDVAKCFRYAFTPDSTLVCEFPIPLCNEYASVGSDVGVLCPPFPPEDPRNPPPVLVYSSSAQSCTVTCPDLTSETYTVVAGTFVGLSQAAADAAAQSFACELATILCSGPLPDIFTNTEQSCTVNCANGTTFTYTTPEGFFSALSQADANLQAFLFACELAALLCSGLPPISTTTSAGVTPPVPNTPLYGNFAQSCSAVCPDGSTFTYVVPGGTYFRESRLAANAVAFSLACNQANQRRVCLSDLETHLCADQFYGEFLDATGLATPITFSLVAGSLPPGVNLDGDFLQGVPTIAGVYSFSIRATGSDGSFTQRTYTQTVGDITPDVLPDGAVGVAYAEALTADGFTSPVFSVSAGLLPDGLTLHPGTGVISGTPTTIGDFDFNVEVTDGTLTCEKTYAIDIAASAPTAYWAFEGAVPLVQSDSISGEPLTITNADSIVAGKIGNTIDDSGNTGVTSAQQVSTVLQHAGNGWSVALWFKRADLGSTFIVSQVTYNGTGLAGDEVLCELTYRTIAGQRDIASSGNNSGPNDSVSIDGLVNTADWNLWVITFTPADGIIRYSINNGAFLETLPGYVFNTALPAEQGSLLVAGSAAFYDEVFVYGAPLTLAQVDYLWNAGAGRTWPITLP